MTKIVVYNTADQYALSRRQVERIIEILPNSYFAPIQDVHLCSGAWNVEPFEYNRGHKTVYFSCLIKQKTKDDVANAVELFLIGLARIRAHSRFYHPLKARERETYEAFVAEWMPRVIKEIL